MNPQADDRHANPDVLIDLNWVAGRLDDASVRLVEVNADASPYQTGHIPGAVEFDWRTGLQRRLIRDFATRDEFEALVASRGIANDTTVILYGDCDNLYAAYSFWLFKIYGHQDCRIMDGGRAAWKTAGRPLVLDVPVYTPAEYRAQPADLSIRAFRDQVLAHIYAGRPLVDARSPEEYAGEAGRIETAHYAGAQRAGHIPTARNIPWDGTTTGDGRCKSPLELLELFLAQEIRPDLSTIIYCHTGERSAHTWFVLTQLLGYPDVRIYDGSWAEWGSLVRAPIE